MLANQTACALRGRAHGLDDWIEARGACPFGLASDSAGGEGAPRLEVCIASTSVHQVGDRLASTSWGRPVWPLDIYKGGAEAGPGAGRAARGQSVSRGGTT